MLVNWREYDDIQGKNWTSALRKNQARWKWKWKPQIKLSFPQNTKALSNPQLNSAASNSKPLSPLMPRTRWTVVTNQTNAVRLIPGASLLSVDCLNKVIWSPVMAFVSCEASQTKPVTNECWWKQCLCVLVVNFWVNQC